MRVPITTHILDTHTGVPVSGVLVTLFNKDGVMATAATNSDGRIETWNEDITLIEGDFRLVFAVADYYSTQGLDSFYPSITIDFTVKDVSQHYHVPLLLSGFGYSTYRGS